MAEAKQRVVILSPTRFAQSEYVRQEWVVNAEEGTTINDVLDPAYWSHVSAEMKPYARIEVRLETGEWLLELLVLTCERNWARVHLLNKYDLVATQDIAPPPQKHIVKWRGPQHKHCVVRIADGEVLTKDHETAEAATQWLRNYENVTA